MTEDYDNLSREELVRRLKEHDQAQTQGDARLEKLYEFSLRVLERYDERFKRLEEKASRYMTATGIAVAVAAIFGKWFVDNGIRPSNWFDWIAFVAGALCLASAAVAWFTALRVLRVGHVMHLCLDEKAIDDFQSRTLDDLHRGYSKAMLDIADTNERLLSKKSQRLKCAGLSITLACAALLAFLALMFARGAVPREAIPILKKCECSMTEDQNKSQDASTSNDSGSGSSGGGSPPPPPATNATSKQGVNPTIRILTEGDKSGQREVKSEAGKATTTQQSANASGDSSKSKGQVKTGDGGPPTKTGGGGE